MNIDVCTIFVRNMKSEMNELVEFLKRISVLKTPALIDAFLLNDRENYIRKAFLVQCYQNNPLPIGFGQTISQPSTVAFMLELLQPESGNEVLDVGFGSGWTTGILASTVGEEGSVVAVEIVPEVFRFGKENLELYKYRNIKLYPGSWRDLPEQNFDCILVSAAAEISVPGILATKLKVGGRMVIPVKHYGAQSILFVQKMNDNQFIEKDFPSYVFVPLL
jgi:protein-L-isoaspartate(D-aspartate) O-methyltransferase